MRPVNAIFQGGPDLPWPMRPNFNLALGAMQGWMPKYGLIGKDGRHYEEWINNHAYIRKQIIPLMLSYPLFFDFMPGKESWLLAYKSMMEAQALKIDGLQSNLVITIEEHAIGGDGNMQEEITNVTRERSEIQYTWQERANKTIARFIEAVVMWGYMDPETKAPRCRNYVDPEDYGYIFTPDYQAGAMMYIEPDLMFHQVIDCWMCFNMLFKSAGDSRKGSRDLTQAAEMPTLDVGLTSITISTNVVAQFGQKLLNEMTILNTIPDQHLILPFDEINPNVKAAPTGFNVR